MGNRGTTATSHLQASLYPHYMSGASNVGLVHTLHLKSWLTLENSTQPHFYYHTPPTNACPPRNASAHIAYPSDTFSHGGRSPVKVV